MMRPRPAIAMHTGFTFAGMFMGGVRAVRQGVSSIPKQVALRRSAAAARA